MKILIATDSFKDSMSSSEAAEALKKGFTMNQHIEQVRIIPMADGGEGTVKSLVSATGGRIISKSVNDPLMRKHDAFFGILGDGKTAVIEMAAASGIELLSKEERNPWITSTYGTGELILAALDNGIEKIVVGIGGSATNDCGAGLAQALGISLVDGSGKQIGKGGGALGEVDRIDFSRVDERIKRTEIIVACDVTSPLTGSTGASQIYGPQKGADPEMVKKLDNNLGHFADKIREFTGKDISNLPGAGAAGGLGGGLVAFVNAELKPGFEIVSTVTHLEDHIIWADMIITGEGKIDHQTKFGKTPAGVSRLAKIHGKPVIAVAGTLGEGYEELYEEGITAVYSIIDKPMSLDDALKGGPGLLQKFALSLARTISI